MDFASLLLAVHEFGHARISRMSNYATMRQSSAAMTIIEGTAVMTHKVTEYDKRSVMNYCNSTWLGNGKLSELDIKSLRAIYPSK